MINTLPEVDWESPDPVLPAPGSDAELASYYEKIAKLNNKLDNLDAYEKARISKIKEACAVERAQIEQQIAMWEASAVAYLVAVGERVRLPDLGVSLGAKPEKGLHWTDEAALKAWAIENDFLLEAKPPDPGPDKNRIKEHFAATGEIPPGAEPKTSHVLAVNKIGAKK